MDNSKNSLRLLLGLILAVFLLGLCFEYLYLFYPDPIGLVGETIYMMAHEKVLGNIDALKFLYLIMVVAMFIIGDKPVNRMSWKPIVILSLVSAATYTLFVFYPFLLATEFLPYNQYLYLGNVGLFHVSFIIVGPHLLRGLNMNVTNVKKEDVMGLSKKKSNHYDITLKTVDGPLVISAPFRHQTTVGSAGSGKSVSVIDPMIFQTMLAGFTGVVYDFKGKPLTDTVFKAYQYLLENKPKNYQGKLPNVSMLDFSNLENSVRVNPLSPKYITSSLVAKTMAQTIAYALEKEWSRKRDFWASSAISLLHATIWNFAKNYPDYSTLPHVISAITSDTSLFANWLNNDPEIKRLAQSTTEAIEAGADSQVQGVLASLRTPMTNLLSPELFWCLSSDDVNIQLNDPEDPQWLCICNDTQKREGLNPAISLLLTLLNVKLNVPGKRPVLYAIDELPTAYIYGLADYMATCRSNENAVLLGMQTFTQLEKEYGKEEAAIIKGNCSNQFWGVVDVEEAEKVAKAFGQYDRQRSSLSVNDSGTSKSYNFETQQIIQASDIRSKKAGEFVGFVANGEPPFFDSRFKMLNDYYKNIPKSADYPVLHHQKEYLEALVAANYDTIFEETTQVLQSV